MTRNWTASGKGTWMSDPNDQNMIALTLANLAAMPSRQALIRAEMKDRSRAELLAIARQMDMIHDQLSKELAHRGYLRLTDGNPPPPTS